MKVLFLDIDGVLNNPGCFTGQSARIAREPVYQLNRILAETDCKIVLTSGWRYHIINGEMTVMGFAAMLRTHGIEARLQLVGHVGKQPDGSEDKIDQRFRGVLIRRWLHDHPEVEHYVALDDSRLGYEGQKIPLVVTDGSRGLTAEDADQAIAILNGTED